MPGPGKKIPTGCRFRAPGRVERVRRPGSRLTRSPRRVSLPTRRPERRHGRNHSFVPELEPGMRVAAVLGGLTVLLTGAVTPVVADDKKEHHAAAVEKHPGLEKFKLLAGEWVGSGSIAGQPQSEIHVKYKVTSGGNTVVETVFPDSDHEMVSAIHLDGDSLVLTHYCHLGNQPRMKATVKAEDKIIAFKFADATNLKSEKDMHMHDATFTFVDKDTLKTEWTLYQDGKPGGKVVVEFKRKK
jgi:hypothetical protein